MLMNIEIVLYFLSFILNLYLNIFHIEELHLKAIIQQVELVIIHILNDILAEPENYDSSYMDFFWFLHIHCLRSRTLCACDKIINKETNQKCLFVEFKRY